MAGLAQYSPFFENPLFSTAIREVPVDARYIGSRFLSAVETYDFDWNETVLTRQQDMANIVDAGAELPLTDRDPMRRVSGEIVDIGQSYIVTKKELMALNDKGNEKKRQLAVKQLLGKTATVKQNIDARMEWMIWQALGEGSINYAKDGIILGLEFGVNFRKTALVRWDDTVGQPTILQDYELWTQNYVDTNGHTPDTYVTSLKALRTVLNDPDVRKGVTGLSDKILRLDELNEFLVGRQLPRMEAYDVSVTYRDPYSGGTRVTQRLLAENKGIFLMENNAIGDLRVGPTEEAGMEPGIFAHSFTEQRPKRNIVEVVAAAFPRIENPDLIGITTNLA